jgi:DNA-binding MarR family transcriptional regulator
MTQARSSIDVDTAVGYVLKQAAAALRTAMEAELRPLQLSVSQYACLELLGSRESPSSAELARGAFVTRQSMHGVLQGLEDRGLVSRPPSAPKGRALPTALTEEGLRLLEQASALVAAVQDRMLAGFDEVRLRRLHDDLAACVAALSGSGGPAD